MVLSIMNVTKPAEYLTLLVYSLVMCGFICFSSSFEISTIWASHSKTLQSELAEVGSVGLRGH